MKLQITLLVWIVAGMVAFAAWRVRAGTESESTAIGRGGDETAASALRADEARQLEARIKDREREIRGRLGLPAMIADGGDPGEDAEIAELYRSGWIVSASLEEVESAKAAAAATKELDDDVAARILAHRASCRYFFSE